MFGYFGQAYLGGADFDADPGGGPSGGDRLAADAASSTDWDVDTTGLGSDETAAATDTAIASGLGVGNSTKDVGDEATAVDSALATGLNVEPPQPPPTVSRSIIRWVDSVSAAAGIRMELDSGSYWRVLFDGTSTPPPPMQDQRASSMLTDGELISASVYKNRELTLSLLLDAPNATSAATEIQKMQRELDRATNVLWWQPTDALPPQFVRTFRGPDITDQVLDWGTNTHRFTVVIEAEPFVLGDLESAGSHTVNVDPAAATNPCYFDITGVKGDVETPLFITTSDSDMSGQKVALATRRRGTPSNVPWYRQAETLTVGVDTAVTAAANASGGSMVQVSFASTPTNALRLSGMFPSGGDGSVDWRGTYRVFARMSQSSSSADVRVQVATSTSAAARNLPVQLNSVLAGSYIVYDLGLVRLPVGNPGRTSGYGVAHPAAGSTLYFYVERASGSGTLNIDYVFLVPADEDYAFVQVPAFAAGGSAVLDGPNGEVYPRNANGELSALTAKVPYVDGRLPHVSPLATTNRVFLIDGIFDGTPFLNTGLTLSVGYWPRYRIIRPVST